MSIPSLAVQLSRQNYIGKARTQSIEFVSANELFEKQAIKNLSTDDIINVLKVECGTLIDVPHEQHTMSLGHDFTYVQVDPVTNKNVLNHATDSNQLIAQTIPFFQALTKQKVYTPVFKKFQPKALSMRAQYYSTDKVLLANIKSLFNLIGPDMNDDYHCEHLLCFNKALKHFLPYITQLQLNFNHPNIEVYSDNPTDYPEPLIVAEAIEQFLELTYKMAHEGSFKEAQRERNRRTKHHFRTLQNYVDEIHRQHDVTLLLRFDLYLPAKKRNLKTDEVKQLFHKFLQSVRRAKSLYMLGYIWKLEFGVTQGLHYHCFFFFDVSKHHQPTDLANKIIEMWCDQIGSNDCHFNCSDPKHLGRYKSPLIGICDLNNAIKYAELLKVLRYLCKRDQFMVHKSIHRKKTFGTGRLISKRKFLGRPNRNYIYTELTGGLK
ncbi:inovirus Gp2 family protein [Acinetobacter baumannii]|nr:inovirus Gp2 family protein [Acinetobacter baumannii]